MNQQTNGCSPRERLLLRVWLCWPFAGAGSIVAVLLLNDLMGTAASVVCTAAVCATGVLWLRHRLRRQRRQRCVLHAEYLNGVGTRADRWRCEQLMAYASTLIAAEFAAARGELSPVDFEYLWGLVHYDARALAAEDRARPPQGFNP